jgi:hypothetical protein
MSNTYRDKAKYLLKSNNPYTQDTIRIPCTRVSRTYIDNTPHFYNGFCTLETPTTKPKKRKKMNTEWRWMTTPMWWIREMMTRPQRRAGKIWEKELLKAVDLEEVDTPSVGRKPHKYYF